MLALGAVAVVLIVVLIVKRKSPAVSKEESEGRDSAYDW